MTPDILLDRSIEPVSNPVPRDSHHLVSGLRSRVIRTTSLAVALGLLTLLVSPAHADNSLTIPNADNPCTTENENVTLTGGVTTFNKSQTDGTGRQHNLFFFNLEARGTGADGKVTTLTSLSHSVITFPDVAPAGARGVGRMTTGGRTDLVSFGVQIDATGVVRVDRTTLACLGPAA